MFPNLIEQCHTHDNKVAFEHEPPSEHKSVVNHLAKSSNLIRINNQRTRNNIPWHIFHDSNKGTDAGFQTQWRRP